MRNKPNYPNKLDKASKLGQFLYRQTNRIPYLPSPIKYNLTISHELKFVWFRVAKVGTRSILHHLKTNDIQLDLELGSNIFYAPRLFKDYFKFAVVRNPWDRIVSCWLNKVVMESYFNFNESTLKKMQDFEQFVDFVAELNMKRCDRHLRLQSALIDLNNLDYIGRIETFDSDLHNIFTRLGIPPKNITAKNVSPNRKPYQSYYTRQTREKVSRIYQRDIQIFGYTFD